MRGGGQEKKGERPHPGSSPTYLAKPARKPELFQGHVVWEHFIVEQDMHLWGVSGLLSDPQLCPNLPSPPLANWEELPLLPSISLTCGKDNASRQQRTRRRWRIWARTEQRTYLC